MMASTNSSLRPRNVAPVINLSRSSSSTSLSSSADIDAIPTFTPPSFTIKELLDAIPAHCFERSALRSSSYVAWDFFLIGCLVYGASFIDSNLGREGALVNGLLGATSRVVAWGVYGYLAGLVGTGVWVIAHECGHQAFSTSKSINNTVGWFLHSALLVPYHSWRISHAQHHAATGHMTRDQVFVPKTRSQRGIEPFPPNVSKREREGTLPASKYEQLDSLLEDAPIWALWNVICQQLFGWPAYIIMNASGQARYPAWTNHFNPSSIIFDVRHRQQILISDFGIAIILSALVMAGYTYGFSAVVKYYLVPYLWVNHWLVMITYLQHTDPLLPHYRDGAFNFQRGALCTIDRNIHGTFFHGIAETHVAHHLKSNIPHYHAWEVTAALKEKLGCHYMKSEENPWKSLWRSYTQCRFVEDEGDIIFYKNAKGQAARRVVYITAGSVSDSGVDVSDLKAE